MYSRKLCSRRHCSTRPNSPRNIDSWDLDTVQREGMKMERAARGRAEITGEDIYKMGAYSFKS